MKKRIAIFIAVSMVFAILPSCTQNADGGESVGTSSAELPENATEAATENYLDTLPDTDFGGYVFKIIGYQIDPIFSFPEEEENGEPVNDALLRRNRIIEQRHNIEIENIMTDDPAGKVRTSVQADDPAYDMMIGSMISISTLAPAGMMYDLNSIAYLRLDQNWWSKPVYETLQFNGKILYTTSPIAPFFYWAPVAAFYNKKLAQEFELEDLNQLVLNNNWTADKFFELTKNKSKDIDGDGAMTEDDFFGFACPLIGSLGLFTSFGGMQTVNDENGYFKLNLENEKTVGIITKFAPIIGDSMNFTPKMKGYALYDENTVFMADRALFITTAMGNAIISFRSMESDFGILPMPKLDSSQGEYRSYGNPWGAGGIAVPTYCNNPERTGLIMETMAALSYDMVRPAMYDNILWQKIARDENSQKMLDIIFDNIYFDLNSIHDFAGSSTLMLNCMAGVQDDFVSRYAKIKDRAEKQLQDLIGAYMAN